LKKVKKNTIGNENMATVINKTLRLVKISIKIIVKIIKTSLKILKKLKMTDDDLFISSIS